MVDIKISGRKVSVSDSLREHVEEKVGSALRVFDIKPMTCDVVLRVDKNPSNPERKACEVTVFVRDNVVRVVASSDDMYSAIDEAADKVTRQLRKYKTRVIDRRQRVAQAKGGTVTQEDLAALIEPALGETEDDQLVREKYIDLVPMTEEEALVQTDLIGHDFGNITLIALIVGIRSRLNRAAYENRLALSEETRDELCRLSPCNDVDEVRRLLSLGRVLALVAAVDCDRKGHDRNAALRLLELGVCRQIADQDYLIQTCHNYAPCLDYDLAFFSWSLITRPRMMLSSML